MVQSEPASTLKPKQHVTVLLGGGPFTAGHRQLCQPDLADRALNSEVQGTECRIRSSKAVVFGA